MASLGLRPCGDLSRGLSTINFFQYNGVLYLHPIAKNTSSDGKLSFVSVQLSFQDLNTSESRRSEVELFCQLPECLWCVNESPFDVGRPNHDNHRPRWLDDSQHFEHTQAYVFKVRMDDASQFQMFSTGELPDKRVDGLDSNQIAYSF